MVSQELATVEGCGRTYLILQSIHQVLNRVLDLFWDIHLLLLILTLSIDDRRAIRTKQATPPSRFRSRPRLRRDARERAPTEQLDPQLPDQTASVGLTCRQGSREPVADESELGGVGRGGHKVG